MTLVAGFRSRNGGVLLCADREEGDGYSKRSVDKITQINLKQCKVFIAGAGPGAVITKAIVRINEELDAAEEIYADLEADHRAVIESCLEQTYERYVRAEHDAIGLVIVVAFYRFGSNTLAHPMMYRTEGTMLIPAPLYAAYGTGKVIADYLADRLYKHGIERVSLTCLAAFIFREAGNASAGVGLGTDMIMIFDGNRDMRVMGPDAVREIESGIPSLAESISVHWSENLKGPDWLIDKPEAADGAGKGLP